MSEYLRKKPHTQPFGYLSETIQVHPMEGHFACLQLVWYMCGSSTLTKPGVRTNGDTQSYVSPWRDSSLATELVLKGQEMGWTRDTKHSANNY